MNLILWSGIVGFAMPFAISVISQPGMSSKVRGIITLVLSAVGGFITAWLAGDLNEKDITTAILIVFTAAIAFYKLWWKGSTFAGSVEAATVIKK